jgi:hypothetical protein
VKAENGEKTNCERIYTEITKVTKERSRYLLRRGERGQVHHALGGDYHALDVDGRLRLGLAEAPSEGGSGRPRLRSGKQD